MFLKTTTNVNVVAKCWENGFFAPMYSRGKRSSIAAKSAIIFLFNILN